MVLPNQVEFMSDLENYFYKVKNDIYTYINNNLKRINKYNFNNEIMKNNFYLVEKIYEEIYSLTNNLNKFFDENNFGLKIKLLVFNIVNNVITPHNELKAKSLQNLYDSINKRVKSRSYDTNDDFAHIYEKCNRRARRLWRKKCWMERDTYNCENRDNVNKINKDLTKIKESISTQINELINNFINGFNPYLLEY